MQLICDQSLAVNYHSESQRARVLSESWFADNAYCLACDAGELQKTPANTKATDFICSRCHHRYELKTFERRPRTSLIDGAYDSMMQRINSGTAPTLCLLERTKDWHVQALSVIHSSFLVPTVVEKRPPLAPNARRAGWVGCNIRLDQIASDGLIDVVADGVEQPVNKVRSRFRRFLPLAQKSSEQRGWTLLTLRIVRNLGKNVFTLADVYEYETQFAHSYPQNRYIKEKIRQQLQILRDLGVVKFVSRGEYLLLDEPY